MYGVASQNRNMGTTIDKDQLDSSHGRSTSTILTSVQEVEGKQLSQKLKILTAIAMFYGNITFVSILYLLRQAMFEF